MSYKFVAGTVKKSGIYDMLLNAMISAGWENISSEKILDGDVMYSSGSDGTKKLYVQLRPYCDIVATSKDSYDNYHIQHTKFPYMSYRLQRSYTPGLPGTVGIFSNPTRYFEPFLILNTSYYTTIPSTAIISIDEGIQYYLSVDKDKVILFTKARSELTKYWQMNYIGLPDIQYAKFEEGRGVVGFTTHAYRNGSFNHYRSNHIVLSEYPDSGDGINAVDPHPWISYFQYTTQPSMTPNANNKYFFSELHFGDDSYGMIGKFEDIYLANSYGLNSGDKVEINGEAYTIFCCHRYADNGSAYLPHYTNPATYMSSAGTGSFPYPVENDKRSGSLDSIAVKL